ncbi:MAG TPA: flagellar filament capping protein FliD [Bryobacteraceae bacterium]|nr:flagellar filament capping protein FliD [Bryobacteraceae bacterium]
MGFSPLTFTGVSTYSADFQKILERTVAIASQPITQLQAEQARIFQQKTLATGLQTSVGNLSTALKSLTELGSTKALGGTSSNTAKVSIGNVTANSPATYNITDITSVARASSATSSGFPDGSATEVSATGTVKLTFDGQEHTITLSPSENNLTGLRNKINGLNLGATASILTTGTGSNPYYLSITSNTSGQKPITLVDDPDGAATNLLATADDGANAEFKINGVAVSKPSNLINDVVSGVTFTILGTTSGSETVSLSLATNRSTLAQRLQSFVTAYNQVVGDTDAQIGEAAGLLTGDLVVRDIKDAMRTLSGFEGTGAIKSLSQFGVTFGNDGKASFDPDAFAALSDSQVQDVFGFMGTNGTGFSSVQSRLTALSDPVTGMIALQNVKYDEADKRISNRVTELTDRLSALQKSTAEKLQMVDALLGSLQSQQTIIEASYKSVNVGIYGKNDG